MKQLFYKKTPLALSILVIIAFLGWLFFLSLVISFSKEIGVSVEGLAVKTEESRSMLKIRATMMTVEEDIKKIDSYFAKTNAVAGFVEIIEKEAEQVGVPIEINSIQLSNNTDEIIHSLAINIKAEGNWPDLIEFIGRIERLPYSMFVNKIVLIKPRKTENQDDWKSTFEIIAHVID